MPLRSMRAALALCLPLLTLGIVSCQPSSGPRCTNVASTRTTVRYATTPGVDAGLQSLDLYRPKLEAGCPTVPVVLYVHGGGWMRGDKANQILTKVDLFAQKLGWVFVSVNYRLSPSPIDVADPDGVRAPTHARDVAASVAWVRANARRYGADPNRIALVGHSAGAGLVSNLGTDESLLAGAGVPRQAVRCVASLDTESYDVADGIARNRSLYENAFGTDPDGWTAASPIHQLTDGEALPPFLIVSHTAAAWQANSAEFRDALVAAGGTATLKVVPLDHEGINDAVGASGDRYVTPPLVAFLGRCLA
ncbi:MAG: alpha/beta hydrolase [Acidimicrobiales bacterium]